MGPVPEAAIRAAVPDGRADGDVLIAPMRLQPESYESFMKRLPNLGQEDAARTEVAEELRRLQIDPEIFYRNAKRLAVKEFSSETLDPTRAPEQVYDVASPGLGLGGYPSGHGSACSTDRAALPMAPLPLRAEAGDLPELASMGAVGGPGLPRPSGLNVPLADEDDCEEIPYMEASIPLGETIGGRMGRETPRGLEARLQIDSLTDDEDEDAFTSQQTRGESAEQDEVETFSLDPDFDYDNVAALSRR
mmetsp:Transcript_1854/g.4275  ORF Transcript_1854/g.4275 Transcript_1854/m.4275 type:complete len:248 (-) Transcript_1854:47-790(-)